MAKNANRWLYIILLVAVLSSFAVIIFDLAPKKYWWLVLVTINLAASVSTVYFVKSFGVKVGLSLTLIIAVLGYVFCSSARLLPFVRENDLFSHYYYFTIACLWVVVMALSKALTQNMSIAFRTMFTFLMILFIEYCMMPVMALFEHYKRGHTEYLFYAIQLSGYLVITGFTMIFYFILMLFETTKLTRIDSLWQGRMYSVFIIVVSLPILIGIKVGHWPSSVLIIIVSSSILVVAKSKERRENSQ